MRGGERGATRDSPFGHHARAGHYTETGFRKAALLPIFLLLFAAVTLTVRLLTLL
jgi:hypothetical protein